MNWRSHPVKLISSYFDHCKLAAVCYLSSYTYVPSLVRDQRENLAVPYTALEGLLERMDSTLRRRNDLAFHSTFKSTIASSEAYRHLPLVDLAGEWTENAANRLSRVLRDFNCQNAAVYASGRSYHLYGFHQLNDREWRWFMARLLMVNDPIEDEVVDAAVIGRYLERLFAEPLDSNVAEDIVRFYIEKTGQFAAHDHASVELAKIGPQVNGDATADVLARLLCLLLLQNPKNDRQIVDSRWVAHRLLGGYSALRWTAHQQQYLFEPRLICQFSTDGRYQVAKKQISLSW